MKCFLINPLSINGQCPSSSVAEQIIRGVLDCVDHISPALVEGHAQLLFDPNCESYRLLTDEDFAATLGSLSGSKGADVRRRWYQYTRNRAKKVRGDRFEAVVESSLDARLNFSGLLPEEALKAFAFLSLGGFPLTQSNALNVVSGQRKNTVRNAHCADSVKDLMPVYKASPKHRSTPYFDHLRNVWVAPMTLDDSIAQRLLIGAFHHEGDYFGYERELRKIVRFKLTLGNEYHGFEVERDELPAEVQRVLFR